MYDGYLAFGGVEVINADRLSTYARNGVGPDAAEVEPCDGGCTDLAEVLGDAPYRTPLLDLPPWFTGTTPEGQDFAGLMVLDLTGVDGSTRTVPIIESLRDGGVPMRGRAGSRVIAVSALAMARSACGLDAGLSWLTSALHPPCADLSGCGGLDLDMFACCPTPICPTVDPSVPPTETVYTGDENWLGIGGTWDPVTDFFQVVPSPVSTNLIVNPNMDAEAAGAVAVRATNYITNPTFGTDTSGWAATNGTLTRVTGTLGAAFAGRIAATSNSPRFVRTIPATAGVLYRVTGRVATQTAAAPRSWSVLLEALNGASAVIGTVSKAAEVSGPAVGTWTEAGTQLLAPAGTVSMRVSFISNALSGEAVLLQQAAMFAAEDWQGDYFDGSSPDPLPGLYAWSGTAHLSTSTLTAPTLAAFNHIRNPSFEVDTAGWTVNDNTDPPVHSAITTWIGGFGARFAIGASATPAAWRTTARHVIPGVTYRFGIAVSGLSGRQVALQVVWRNAAGATVGTTAVSDSTAAGASVWAWVESTFTAPPGAYYAEVEVQEAETSTGDDFWVDAAIWTVADNPTGWRYFDGLGGAQSAPASPYAGVHVADSEDYAAWTGAVDGSHAVAYTTAVSGWAGNGLLGAVSEPVALERDGSRYLPASRVPQVGDSTFSLRADLPTDARACGVMFQLVTGLTIGEWYTLSGWAYKPANVDNMLLTVAFGAGSELVTEDDEWAYRQVSFQATAVEHFVGWQTSGPTTLGESVWMDAMMLQPTRSLTMAVAFEDDRPAWETFGWDWNPAFGNFVEPAWDTSTEQAHTGDHSVKVTWGEIPEGSDAWGSWFGHPLDTGMVPGDWYTFSGWVYVPAGSPDVSPDVLFRAVGTPVTERDEWVYREVTFQATSVNAFPGWRVAGSYTDAVAYFDDVRLVPGRQPFDFFDGGSPDSEAGSFFWNGPAEVSSSTYAEAITAMLAGPVLGCTDDALVSWTVVPADGNAMTVTPLVLDTAGTTVLATGDPVTVPGTGGTVSWYPPVGWEDWRPALEVPPPGADITLTVTMRAALSLAECVDPHRRQFRGVVTVSGPTVVERIADRQGEVTMARVEWTWAATDPFKYGVEEEVLRGVPSGGGAAEYQAPLVQLSATSVVTAAATACPLPAATLRSCTDPPVEATCCTPPTPPLPPAPAPDDCFVTPTSWTRRQFQVPPAVAPEAVGVPHFRFVNDASPKTGVRVRIWEDPDPDFGAVPECGFVHEFTIGYIEPGAEFWVDGSTGSAYATCEGVVGWQPADRVMEGNYGGPTEPLLIGCGNRYHVAVDVPQTYAATCGTAWTAGQPQGALTWSVGIQRREG